VGVRKRIADWLEKMSVGFFLGAFFNHMDIAVLFSVIALILSLLLSYKEEP
jgi:hypothetical protein